MHSETVELSTGAKIFVARKGSGDELVVLLHAVDGDHTSWYHQMEALDESYCVVSCDLRGHGRSSFDVEDSLIRDAVSISAFAKDTIALIEHCGYRRAHVVGLSMGGVVALEVFKRRSDMVQSLALANTWAYHPEGEGRIAFMQERLARMPLPDVARELVPALFPPGTAADVVERLIAVESQKNKHVFLSSWTSMFQADYRRMLELIDVPLLLIGGTLDRETPTDPLLTSIQQWVPTAELVNIEGANHFSNLDHPQEFTRALRSHLLRARTHETQRLGLPESRRIEVEASTTAQALVALLARRGVRYLFSSAGAELPGDSELRTIPVPHESTAIAMAHGYWLVSGKPQAVLAHGTANISAGIINASRAHVPMLLMAGRAAWYESEAEGCRTNAAEWGQDTFDQAASLREFTKWDYELKGARNLETIVDRALAIAASDPAGPVCLTLPKEPLYERVDRFSFAAVARQQPQSASEASAEAIERAARLIARAQRPLVITAELGRYRGGPEALVQLSQRHGVPVVEHGKRNFFNFPTRHPMHLGFNPSPFVKQADLIVVVESHVPWIPAFANLAHDPKVIQIGVDPLQARIPMRSFPADVALAGNPALTLRRLTSWLDKARPDAEKIAGRFAAFASEHRRVMQQAQTKAIADAAKPRITKQFLSYCIGEAIDDRCVIWNEVDLEPQLVPRRLTDSWFESSIASAPGWALGAALGGQLASPDATMVVTLGDAGYLSNVPLSAHTVAAANKLPILILVANGGAGVQIEKVAESAGAAGLRVDNPRELPAMLRRALGIVREGRQHLLLNVNCEG